MKEINERLRFQESRRKSISQAIVQLKSQIESTKKLLEGEDDEVLKNEFKKDLKLKIEAIKNYETEQKELKTRKEIEKSAILEFQNFLELFRLIPSSLKKFKEMKALDETIQMVFSNLTVEGKNVVSYTLKTPFKEVFERRKSVNCPKWSG